MVEGEISARFEDPTPDGKHEIQIRFVPECRGSDPNATSRGCAAAANPTAAGEVFPLGSQASPQPPRGRVA